MSKIIASITLSKAKMIKNKKLIIFKILHMAFFTYGAQNPKACRGGGAGKVLGDERTD
jgi:hypothetical protein